MIKQEEFILNSKFKTSSLPNSRSSNNSACISDWPFYYAHIKDEIEYNYILQSASTCMESPKIRFDNQAKIKLY